MQKLPTLAALSFLLSACGGGGLERPEPIKTKIDEMMLARVPSAEQNSVVSSQSAYQRSRLDFHNAKLAHDESKTKVKLAESDKKQAKLDVDKAKATAEDAKNSADQNRISAADRETARAKRKVKAMEAKVKAEKECKKALKLNKYYREADMFYREANWEFQKAKVAKAKNIKPQGFEYGKFQQQESKRKKQVGEYKKETDQAMGKARNKYNKFREMAKDSKVKAEGNKCTNPDKPGGGSGDGTTDGDNADG